MVIDSSALLAILLAEADHQLYIAALRAAPARLVSAVTHYETSIVVEARRGDDGRDDHRFLVEKFGIRLVAFDRRYAELARDAYRRFGRGYHAAKLNFADCCAYALAKDLDEPLLFKGGDFALTDVKSAL